MSQQTDSKDLHVARRAAAAAAEISRDYYRGNFEIRIKEDRTPVTEADVKCEQAIRSIILEACPHDGFYGEETGLHKSKSARMWLVDPIDGTKGFVRQYPFFSTQIALMDATDIVLGVSSGTMFDELACAEKGAGAYLNGQKLQVSATEDLASAAISTGNLKSLAQGRGWQALGNIVADADRIRGYGDFYHYHLLASGKIDAVIESDVNILDIAALSIIVTEAGGVFTDLNGHPPGLHTKSVLAANPALHECLLTRLKNAVP